MLDHPRGFGNSMRESLKQIALWSVKYFTNSHSYYPVRELGMKLASLLSMASLPVVTMGPSDIAFMRQSARDHGQLVHQMTASVVNHAQAWNSSHDCVRTEHAGESPAKKGGTVIIELEPSSYFDGRVENVELGHLVKERFQR